MNTNRILLDTIDLQKQEIDRLRSELLKAIDLIGEVLSQRDEARADLTVERARAKITDGLGL